MKNRYKIWKASITEYRVLDTWTGEVTVMDTFTAVNCTFRTDEIKYDEARNKNFVNSGDPNDYFAWIECTSILPFNNEVAEKRVFYNPFKGNNFNDRETMNPVLSAHYVEIKQNLLSYVPK